LSCVCVCVWQVCVRVDGKCVCVYGRCVYVSGVCACGWQVCVCVFGMCALTHTHLHIRHTHTPAQTTTTATAVARKPMSTILFTTCPLLNVLLLFSTYTLLQDGDAEVETKPMSTILFGSTVEFEMAILTMAFLASGDVCPFLSLHTHTCIQRITCMRCERKRKRVYWRLLDNGVVVDGWMQVP
jgi:hypothetical protein